MFQKKKDIYFIDDNCIRKLFKMKRTVEIENTIPLTLLDKVLCQDSGKMDNIPDSSVI
jgi:hypothetical protein